MCVISLRVAWEIERDSGILWCVDEKACNFQATSDILEKRFNLQHERTKKNLINSVEVQ